MFRLAAFIVLLVPALTAAQATAPQADAARQAQAAGDLFVESCMTHFGDDRALAAWVKEKGYSEVGPEMTRAVLQGDLGTVWSASNDIGDFLILLVPGGNCEVWARRADPKLSMMLFEKAVQGAQRPGRKFERDKDRELEADGIKYRQLAYFMTQEKAKGGWAFIAIVTESDKAAVQVRLSADRVK